MIKKEGVWPIYASYCPSPGGLVGTGVGPLSFVVGQWGLGGGPTISLALRLAVPPSMGVADDPLDVRYARGVEFGGVCATEFFGFYA